MTKPVTLPTSVAALGAAVNDIATYGNYFADSGSANAMVVAPTSGLTFSYAAGVSLQVKVAATNTGATTINVNSLGVKNVTNTNKTALFAGQLLAGAIVIIFYDGTEFQLMGLVFPQSIGEAAHGVIPTNTVYSPGDVRRYGAVANSSTDCTAAIQSALNASAGYNAVYVPANAGDYFRLTQAVTAPADTHIRMEDGAILQWTATSAGSTFNGQPTVVGIEVAGDNFTIEGKGQLIGSNDTAAVECGILRVGTSAAARGTGLLVKDVEMTNWGYYGIATQYMQKHYVTGCRIHGNGYTGIAALSGQEIRILYNELYAMSGQDGNAYGINISHDPTGYNTDPNRETLPRQTANPFCIDVEIAFNLIHDIPLWAAVVCHGGYEVRIHNNAVYNCFIGIECASSSGVAAAYAGENNSVTDNVIYALQINGNASGVTAGYTNGIIVNGGSSTNGAVGFHRGVVVKGNHIYGMGDPLGTSASNGVGSGFSVYAAFMEAAVIDENVIRNGEGVGIYAEIFDGSIKNNCFGAPGTAANSVCVYMQDPNKETTISGNKHSPNGGNIYAVGLNLNTSGGTNVVCSGNDFSECGVPYASDVAFLTRGTSDVTPRIQVLTAPAGDVVSLSAAGQSPAVWVDINASSAFTITGFQGSQVGQRVHLSQLGSSSVTINDSSGALRLQGGSATLSQNSTMEFLCVSTANPTHLETSRAIGLT